MPSALRRLSVADLAAEVFPNRVSGPLLAARLLARGRIEHYTDPGGQARIDPSAIDAWIQRGQTDAEGPVFANGWIDNRDVSAAARAFERAAASDLTRRLSEAVQAEDARGDAVIRATASAIPGTLKAQAGQLGAGRLGVATGSGSLAIHSAEQARKPNGPSIAAEAALVQALRSTAKTVIHQGRWVGTTWLQKLYASRRQYLAIMRATHERVMEQNLASARVNGRYVVVPVSAVAKKSTLHAISELYAF